MARDASRRMVTINISKATDVIVRLVCIDVPSASRFIPTVLDENRTYFRLYEFDSVGGRNRYPSGSETKFSQGMILKN